MGKNDSKKPLFFIGIICLIAVGFVAFNPQLFSIVPSTLDPNKYDYYISSQIIDEGDSLNIKLNGETLVTAGSYGWETGIGYAGFIVMDDKIIGSFIGSKDESGSGVIESCVYDYNTYDYCKKRFLDYNIILEQGFHEVSLIYLQSNRISADNGFTYTEHYFDLCGYGSPIDGIPVYMREHQYQLAENLPCEYWTLTYTYRNPNPDRGARWQANLAFNDSIINKNSVELYNSISTPNKYFFESIEILVKPQDPFTCEHYGLYSEKPSCVVMETEEIVIVDAPTRKLTCYTGKCVQKPPSMFIWVKIDEYFGSLLGWISGIFGW